MFVFLGVILDRFTKWDSCHDYDCGGLKIRRKIISDLVRTSNYYPEASEAASGVMSLLKDHHLVCLHADPQVGKTTIARLIAKHSTILLDDEKLEELKFYTTFYVENVANNDLCNQARENFAHLGNVTVVPITALNKLPELPADRPVLFIIDESHQGCNAMAVRLNALLELIKKHSRERNQEDRILLVSATGFSSIYEASKEQTVRGYKSAIYLAEPSTMYRGIRQFLAGKQVVDNSDAPCFLLARDVKTEAHRRFITALLNHKGAGLFIIRAKPNQTANIRDYLLSLKCNGEKVITEEQIRLVAKGLKDVPKQELSDWSNVCKEFNHFELVNRTMVVIVRDNLRVGIAMEPVMKELLVATWDGTASAISSVVQALPGRACGYHNNDSALHCANKSMLEAHCELATFLQDKARYSPVALGDIADAIEAITDKYNVSNWDAGLSNSNMASKAKSLGKKIEDKQYLTSSWAAVSMNIESNSIDQSLIVEQLQQYLQDTSKESLTELVAQIIHTYRGKKNKLLKIKPFRKLQSEVAYGQFLNKKTFSNLRQGQRRVLETAITSLQKGNCVSFNRLFSQGKGRRNIKKVQYVVYFLSTHNVAASDENLNTRLPQDMLNNFCDTYGIPRNNTVVIIFKKGKLDEDLMDSLTEQLAAAKVSGSVASDSVYTMYN